MELSRDATTVRISTLGRVLDVVRELGAARDLSDTLSLIARSIVEVLDFGAAAINVAEPSGYLRVAAVAGPDTLRTLLDAQTPTTEWLAILEIGERWGELRFISHHEQSIWQHMTSWVPDTRVADGPDAWHPMDTLLAPMWAADGALLGVLSVDDPAGGTVPSAEQQTLLELFAAQAAVAIGSARLRQESEEGRQKSEQRRQESELRRETAEKRWQQAFESSPVGTAIVDLDGTITEVNDTLSQLLGRSADWLVGADFMRIAHPDDLGSDLGLFVELLRGDRDSYEIEKRYLHADGHVVWGVLHVGSIRDDQGRVANIIAQIADITDRKRVEAELALRASHDPLTELPNRASMEARITGYLSRRQPVGVLFLDVDRFKTVNDSLGHDAGDDLLRELAARLVAAVEPRAVLGRVGGDEFVVLAPSVSDPVQLMRVADEIMASLSEPMLIRGHRHTVTLSIGVATTRAAHRRSEEVLQEADQAMLRAKRHGRARVEFYDPAQDRAATVADLELEQSLRVSLAQGEGLHAYFQPILRLADNQVEGYESLVRWEHAVEGLLDPERFLPLAENTGLIVPLGWWMLHTSCRALAELTAVQHPEPPTRSDPARRHLPDDGTRPWVAVNISGSQLGRGRLVPELAEAMGSSGLTSRQVHLEITETALIQASAASKDEVNEVAESGVQIALDDFGTGYSSLTLLRDLPVSIVKIDRSFIAPVGVERNATAIVRRLVALCQELGVDTVAEGVETQAQLTALRALGCTHAQGYLIGPPEPLALTAEQRRLRMPRSSA